MDSILTLFSINIISVNIITMKNNGTFLRLVI